MLICYLQQPQGKQEDRNLSQFFEELKRRNVFRVGIAYVAAARGDAELAEELAAKGLVKLRGQFTYLACEISKLSP